MRLNDVRFYVVTEPEHLRGLCIRNNYFTCGSGRQYEKLFEMNERESGFSLEDIALIIWTCSDTDNTRASYEEILGQLEAVQDDYLRMLEAIVRDSETA